MCKAEVAFIAIPFNLCDRHGGVAGVLRCVTCTGCVHFISLHNLQNALRNLARVRLGLGSGLWLGV